MITHALKDRPLPVYGDGLYVRDWIHVRDHCRGLLAAVGRGEPGAVYNFGGNAERTNLSVVRAVLKALGKPEDLIERITDRPGHDRRYAIDTSYAESELEWTPDIVNFEEGLASTVEWYLGHEAWWRRVHRAENTGSASSSMGPSRG
jgi:dTDP-glucose 4,6-dehydratase